ncbi:MAG: hypothetical protein COA45_04050 [Zetaproteobacteria bacterium]|nr:MAG: hypothetical protein COA45_04050 [Zetaproteobacteria bacterium]
MTQLDLTNMENIADITYEAFVSLADQGYNSAAVYYQAMALAAEASGNDSVEDYANLAESVVRDDNVNGQLANNYTEAVAEANNVNFDDSTAEGRANRLRMQYELMQNDLKERQDNILDGGTGELNYEDTNNIHEEALDRIGLPPEAFSLYIPLSQTAEHDPAAAQEMFLRSLPGDGLLDVLSDAARLGFGTEVSGDQSLLDLMQDYGHQASWLNFMIEALQQDIQDYIDNNSDTSGIQSLQDALEQYQSYLNLVGSIDELANWLGDIGNALANIPQWIGDLLNDWGGAKDTGSPLILDLDGQGIDLASVLGTGAVYWDIDLDGYGEKSGWISGNDGLLAIDLNSDGVINDHAELFGSLTTDGFSVLAAYDSNSDNAIDINDAQFNDLLVWVDANSDGYSQSGELFSLTDLGITSINLNASLVDYDIAGNHVTHESTFTINGQTQTIVDAWFAYDNANSHYQESYTLDIRTLYLPTLRGFGDVKDLHIAMSMDETLLLMVQEIAVADAATLFDPTFDLNSKIEAVLYRWAGVDSVDPNSRGDYVDARQLEFFEQYLGDEYLEYDFFENPGVNAGNIVTGMFGSLTQSILPQILVQSAASSFFNNDVFYSVETGQVENSSIDEINLLTPNQILNQTTDTSNAYVISDINSSYVIDENNGGGYDEIWIQGVQESELRLVRVGLNLEINIGSETITVMNQFKSDNHLDNSYDYFRVENIVLDDGTKIDLLNDLTFTGTSGVDVLQGLHADDTLIGAAGDDDLRGDSGNDTYVWSVGDGNDTISEFGGNDSLVLHGVQQSGVSFVRSGSHLSINIGNETITVNDHFLTHNDYKIENVAFDDGSVINLQVLLNVAPTAQDDAFIGDQDLSLSGNVLVNNGSGLDSDPDGTTLGVVAGTYASLHGSVVVSANGDFIYTPTAGYNGADSFTYTLDDGFGGSDTATVNITVRPPNVAPIAQDDAFTGDEDISITGNVLSDNGNGVDTDPDSDPMTVVAGTFATTNGSVVISSNGSFTYTPNTGYVGTDSFTYTLQDDRGASDVGTANITVNALGNNPNAINGTSANDTLNGDPSGMSNDTLIGYGGNDILNGMLGNDSYEWSVGDGDDTINETGGVDQLVLHGVIDSDISLEYMSDGSLKVHIGSEAITVNYHFYSDKYSSSYYDTYHVESILLDDGSTIDLLNNLTLTGTASNETITGTNAGDVLYGLAGSDIINANGGADTLIGGSGIDTLNGMLGNDSYEWSVGDGNDIINETGGVDQLVLHGVIASDISFENMSDGSLKVHIGSEAITVIYHFYSDKYSSSYYDTYHVESILLDDGSTIDLLNNLTFTGTASGETIIGTNGDDVLYGLTGNDIINASGGADTLIGGSGIDTLNGMLGNDSYEWSVGDGNDIINETGGVDQLVLHGVVASDISLEYMSDGSLKVHIGSEEITVIYHFYSDKYSSSYYDTYQVESILLDDGSTIDLLNNITLTGTANSETIDGLNAATTFIGEAGNDILNGKLGNDSYEWSVGDGNDTINETGGVDQLVLHGVIASDIRFENMSNGSLKVYIGSEEITIVYHFYSDKYSSSYYDTYQVETLLLDDGSTIDLLNNLTFTGTASGETINGLNANDILFGLDGADTLNGNNGNDVLYGGGGSDYLYGNAGDDVLYGGAGVDMVYGQAGADTFAFESSSAFTASDNIQDFKLSENDKLDISDLLIGYDALTDLITDFVQITDDGTHSTLAVDADGGADNFVQVAYLYNEIGLTDEDALETSGNLITV